MPAYEVAKNIDKAVELFILRGKTWSDSYNEMLLRIYKIPPEAITGEGPGLFLDRKILESYRPPTWDQFVYRVRWILLLRTAEDGGELPKGKRGKANQSVPGPGFFEIDATHFQIQLTSRLTKALLVGRPTVYLIVDVFDGTIVGYAVTLENPSWAIAALALYNCFSDKAATFARLGLNFESKDWPCHELPSVLTADRAELVSNMGQEFPSSGIRVCITESMEPRAKGTVEGKHGEMKKRPTSRFDLPGRFEKMRRRADGRWKE